MTGNIKALTDTEMKYVVSRYKFELYNDFIMVIANGRKTLHDRTKGFSLLLPIERRRIKITEKAIDFWIKEASPNYTLIEVQNAINTLVVTYQNVTQENIRSQLKRGRSKLDNLFKEGDN